MSNVSGNITFLLRVCVYVSRLSDKRQTAVKFLAEFTTNDECGEYLNIWIFRIENVHRYGELKIQVKIQGLFRCV